jgi:hypothetical protein
MTLGVCVKAGIACCLAAPAVFGLSLSDMQSLCAREPAMMVLRPELVNSKLTTWAEVLGTPKEVIVQTIKVRQC